MGADLVLPRLRGRLSAVASLSEVFLYVFFCLIIEQSIVLLKLDSFYHVNRRGGARGAIMRHSLPLSY